MIGPCFGGLHGLEAWAPDPLGIRVNVHALLMVKRGHAPAWIVPAWDGGWGLITPTLSPRHGELA